MKKILLLNAFMVCALLTFAQGITTPPSGGNQKSEVSQWIGPVKVTITYSSPDVHGPNGEDRKGKIWGGPAHYGYIDQVTVPQRQRPGVRAQILHQTLSCHAAMLHALIRRR